MIFYDFEVLKYDWLAVFINVTTREKRVIYNNSFSLKEYYNQNKNDIFIGYNNKGYDQYIFKGILLGMNPKQINDMIIIQGIKGYDISPQFNSIKLIQYDVYQRGDGGLKSLEGFFGSDIEETSVPFDIDRKITDDEMQNLIHYCTHDVEQTIMVFSNRINDFKATLSLIKAFGLNRVDLSKTHAQLSAKILECKRVDRSDEFEYMQAIPSCIKIKNYPEVLQFYEETSQIKDPAEHYKKHLKIDIAGIPHVFGWGGIHGATEKPVHLTGNLLHIDVASMYPSIMIEHGLLTRNSTKPEKYKNIYDTRLSLKRAGKKQEQAPYKIVLNSTYGICKDIYSDAYDPRNANAVCVTGQLMLLDLIEKLEPYCRLIQSNTDGLIIEYQDYNFDIIDDICFEWETRNRVKLEFENLKELYQGDVNNYVYIDEYNKITGKGGYVKELTALNYDLPIVNKAIINYLVYKIPVSDTVLNCNELKEFQKIYKLSGKYKYAWHNNKIIPLRCFRVFASLDDSDTWLGKQKQEGATVEKFASCPEHCFIYNQDVNGISTKDFPIDKQWYINIALKRINEKFMI